MLPALALFWPFVSAQILEIAGEGRCPSSERVSEQVQKIVDPGGSRRVDERAIITREGESLRIVLRAPDGRTLGERVLPADGACEDLAQIVAVVLAAWISDVHPASTETLPPLPTTTETGAPSGIAPPAPAPSPLVIAVGEPALGIAGDVVPLAPAIRGVAPRHVELGAALGIEAPATRTAALLSIAWAPVRSGVGWTAAATITLPHDDTLADGTVRWSRWPIATGIVWRTMGERAALDLGAGAALAWERFSGRDFPSTSSASGFTWGGFASLRAAVTGGIIVPFASVTAFGWAARSTAFTRPNGTELDLPRLDVALMAGATIRL